MGLNNFMFQTLEKESGEPILTDWAKIFKEKDGRNIVGLSARNCCRIEGKKLLHYSWLLPGPATDPLSILFKG